MKDAKGHGSDPRGAAAGMHSPANVLGENDSTYHGNAPAGGSWQTRLGFYSLEQGKVGQETYPPIVATHGSPVAAMRSLNSAIDNRVGGAQTYHIVAPNGAKLSLNEAYQKHFGEAPRQTRSGGYAYPRLKKGK